jgi:hypothetical protein
MSTVTIQLPEGVQQKLQEVAIREGVTLDQLLASAASEKLSAMLSVDYLRERAKRGSPEKLRAFLAKSPDVPPMPGDEL